MAASQPGRRRVLTTQRAYAHTVALMAAERAARVGARMRERRIELGLSQPQVADRMPVVSVTKDYISRWELGKVEASDSYLEMAAKALETTVSDLMAGPVAERKPKGITPDLKPPDRLKALEELVSSLDEQVRLLRAETATRDAEALQRIEAGFLTIQGFLRPQPR